MGIRNTPSRGQAPSAANVLAPHSGCHCTRARTRWLVGLDYKTAPGATQATGRTKTCAAQPHAGRRYRTKPVRQILSGSSGRYQQHSNGAGAADLQGSDMSTKRSKVLVCGAAVAAAMMLAVGGGCANPKKD